MFKLFETIKQKFKKVKENKKMATNYTFGEAVAIISKGKDMEAIQDLGKRYPILVQKTTVVVAKAGKDFVELMGYMPEYLTANKVNTEIKKAVFGSDNDNNEDEAPAKAIAKNQTSNDVDDSDYESMNAKQLWDILGKAGLRKTAKSTKKSDLVEACKAMDANSENVTNANDTADETEKSANPYEGMKAMALFKECEKRGLDVEPKKSAKYYVDVLTEADNDDWDKPEKTTKKNNAKKTEKIEPAEKKNKAKVEKKAKPADDDGDDWDI